ncbi:MAG: hypothetical protein OHK0012_21800 [Synechococcales cyanobacterium]
MRGDPGKRACKKHPVVLLSSDPDTVEAFVPHEPRSIFTITGFLEGWVLFLEPVRGAALCMQGSLKKMAA